MERDRGGSSTPLGWPRGMRIGVDELDRIFLELLFVRCVWDLPVEAPELDPRPDAGDSHRPDQLDVDTWATWWTEAREAAWSVLEMSPVDDDAAAAQLRQRTGWIRQFGAEGLDTLALERRVRELAPPLGRPLKDQPEWHSRQALLRAWEAGLRTVVVLPYPDRYARRLSRHHLVVSAPVRNAPDAYEEALALMV